MHRAGYKLTTNPHKKFDVAFSFEDTTIKVEDDTHSHLRETTSFINGKCLDISKVRVENVFRDIFGYSMMIDPRTHIGSYVKKSDTNGLHDGQILTEPTEPESGYVYQKLINNLVDKDRVRDIRVLVIGATIPFITYRYRSTQTRFHHTSEIAVTVPENEFSPAEIETILRFCNTFGVDYGELDILRDNDDGKIYIVDVNITCGGPMPGKHISRRKYRSYINTHIAHFERAFLQ